MTKRDRQALARYVRWVANELGLRDWTVLLSDRPAVEGCDGEMVATFGQRHITIRFKEDFRDDNPENQRDTVVHELIHAHLAICQEMVEDDLGKALSDQAHRLFVESYTRSLEFAVDALSKAFCPHIPLIAWAAPVKKAAAK